MSAFNSFLVIIEKTLNRLLQGLMLLVTVVVTWQVVSRYVLNSPSSFTEELARFLLIWITLLGCALAYRHNNHLGLDMVYSQANEKYKKFIHRVIHVCVGFFAVSVMVIGGFRLMMMTETLGQSSPVLGIDISVLYSVIPISGILVLLFSINALFSAPVSEE